jgi:hypothetical protein
MKIGIYGDSFGAGYAFNISANGKKLLEYIGLDWTEILATKYAVTNYSTFSSSLVYSVDMIEKTHIEFDKIILLVTHPGRITMGNPSKLQPTTHFINYDYSKLWADRAFKEGWLKELNSVLDYYFYIYNDDHANVTHRSLVNYVKYIRPDTVLIPNFSNSVDGTLGNTLIDIFEMENKEWNIEYPIFDYDMRKCHMTKENNEIFATCIDYWLQGNPVCINLDNFVKPLLSKERYIFKDLL